MTATNKLGLELLQNAAANQTLANTTFARLNQLVQAGVVDKDLAAPPASPTDESLYIVGAAATGLWAGRDGQLAYWLTTAGAWQFVTPKEGFFLHVNDEDLFYKFTGTAWEAFSGGGSGGGMTNPMTSIRDLIVGGTGGVATRLPGPTSEGMVLTRIGNALAWAIATGLSNPMTAAGDIIIGASSGTPARLGAGSAGQVLTIVSGAPVWVTPSGGGGGGGTGDFKKDGSVQMTGPLDFSPLATVTVTNASTDYNVNASTHVLVTGTGTLASFGLAKDGSRRTVRFATAITLVHSSYFFLPSQKNIVTRENDVAEFESMDNGGTWRCLWYMRGDGTLLPSAIAMVRSAEMTDLNAVKSDLINLVWSNPTVSDFGDAPAGTRKTLIRTGYSSVNPADGSVNGAVNADGLTVTLVHSDSSLRLPGGANIGMVVGDSCSMRSLGNGRWYCEWFQKGNGRTVAPPADPVMTSYTVENLPTASTYTRRMVWCSDMNGGEGLVVSNGSGWIRVADGAAVTV